MGEDGFTVWVSAAAMRPSTSVVSDHDLTSVDFAQAVPYMINSLKDKCWPNQRVVMLACFWGAIMLHRHWNSRHKSAQKGLMLFQEEQYWAWHNVIPIQVNAWNISIINELVITSTCDRVYRDKWNKQDLSSDYKVCST